MPKPNDVTYYDHIKDRSELAITYAKDGAYSSAARILELLAKEIREHADAIKEIEHMTFGRDLL